MYYVLTQYVRYAIGTNNNNTNHVILNTLTTQPKET